MLFATNTTRMLALNMHLRGEKFSNDAGKKGPICVRTIHTDIKKKLVCLGIPADEILFIQYVTTDKARKCLFEDINSRRRRVLFGSTSILSIFRLLSESFFSGPTTSYHPFYKHSLIYFGRFYLLYLYRDYFRSSFLACRRVGFIWCECRLSRLILPF